MSRKFLFPYLLLFTGLHTSQTNAQDLNAVRDDQINRLQNYILAAIQPSGMVRDAVVTNGTSFHPATPDAAGFALLGLSALDHLDKLPDAEQRVINILSAYSGNTPGVTPERSDNGFFWHFLDPANGTDPPGWDDAYTPIGTALLVAGAQFARNHFSDNPTIASLTEELTNSVDFDAAIHPSLDGGIFLDVGKSGEGVGGTVSPWNEFMLVESLALRQPNNERARAVQHLWLDVDNLPKRNNTLTDNPGGYAPAFWVHQMHFFNGDFRHSDQFEFYFDQHQEVDQAYSSVILGEEYRYGFTAGLVPPEYNNNNPYHADSLGNHPGTVFSPSAVAAWGDMETLLEFYNDQIPSTHPGYKYGMVRVSADDPNWIPNDAGLVDHLFLLFGLVESIDPDFFADRLFPPYIAGDFNSDGVVDGGDYLVWQRGQELGYDAADLADWQANYGATANALSTNASIVPEPDTLLLTLVFLSGGMLRIRGRRFRQPARA